jgi:5-methylcytosine-specific restriction endonuclease McrA
MDELTIIKMKKLRESGMSYKKIGLQVGVHKNTVMLHLNPSSRGKHNEDIKKYYEDNKGIINERRKEYGREYQKIYRSKNKEYIEKYNHDYSQNNVEKQREYSKRYYEENKEREIERSKIRYINNKKQIKENNKRYRKINKDKIRIRKRVAEHKRKAKEKLLDYNYSPGDWTNCKNHFNNKCAYCGKEKVLTQDHFIALSKGGEYTLNNIVPACVNCNSSKSNKDFFEWYPRQPFYNKSREKKILKFLNYNNGHVQQLSFCI